MDLVPLDDGASHQVLLAKDRQQVRGNVGLDQDLVNFEDQGGPELGVQPRLLGAGHGQRRGRRGAPLE